MCKCCWTLDELAIIAALRTALARCATRHMRVLQTRLSAPRMLVSWVPCGTRVNYAWVRAAHVRCAGMWCRPWRGMVGGGRPGRRESPNRHRQGDNDGDQQAMAHDSILQWRSTVFWSRSVFCGGIPKNFEKGVFEKHRHDTEPIIIWRILAVNASVFLPIWGIFNWGLPLLPQNELGVETRLLRGGVLREGSRAVGRKRPDEEPLSSGHIARGTILSRRRGLHQALLVAEESWNDGLRVRL